VSAATGEPAATRSAALAEASAAAAGISAAVPRARHRRTVAGRLLASYVLVLIAFAVTVGWSFLSLREAARDAELLRAGYAPLLLRIGVALAEQNVFNAQLNHITAAKNIGDVREWIETALRTRPATFAHVREAAERGLGDEADPALLRFRDDVVRDVLTIERALVNEPERFGQLFQALAAGDRETAERTQNELVKREAEGAHGLRSIKARVEDQMESLTREAKRREQRSIQLLVGLGLLTLLVGVVTSLYARRVLAPLTAVTERANAVALGDLTPRQVVATNDEIGELATTFESMVAAIQRARSELVQAERLATIGKMAAHITHEIRNPLSSIGLNVELLEEEVQKTGEREPAQLVAAIKGEVDRLSRISEQYLSVARRPRPQLERERIDDLVGELLAFVRPELSRGSVVSRFEVDEGVPDVLLDESQMRQALLNLIRNAREAMPKGGELSIEVRRAAGGGVDLIIADRGTGVPEEVRSAIFDPFFTTKQRGTGLGLAVTREIVQTHHGEIACEARAGGGTLFRIHLPEAEDAARVSASSSS
jgi:two-component system, NtrC family, sensor kinase